MNTFLSFVSTLVELTLLAFALAFCYGIALWLCGVGASIIANVLSGFRIFK